MKSDSINVTGADLKIICEICGENHNSSNCTFLHIKHHVNDKIILSRARLTLPDILRLEKMSSGGYDILADVDIKSGTQFGPLEAKQTFTLNPEIIFPLKQFSPNEYFTEYYLDTCNELECNWMMFVQPAISGDEQNLICYQKENNLYYATTCDIFRGETLKVWYSPFYAKLMNKELLKKSVVKENVDYDINTLLKKQQNLIQKDVWNCKFCDFHERNITKFAAHISEHYSSQLKKVCKCCKSTFPTHLSLKKHLHIVHGNAPPQKNLKKFDDKALNNNKNLGKDSMVGGPLLNELLTDSMDNTNLFLQQNIEDFDIQNIDNQNILLDGDSLNLGMDNLISDNDNFNFDLSADQEEHVCDICMKPFNKLKQLIQHLQMHTGKYTCPKCLVIFSRNENLKAHKCNLSLEMHQKCPFCSKTFSLKKYLSRHILVMHGKKYQCVNCKKNCTSEKLLQEHNCLNTPDKDKFTCMFCNKKFAKESYMKKHLKTHSRKRDASTPKSGEFVCEVCAKTFDSLRNLRRHTVFHLTKDNFPCNQCDKKFSRRDTLRSHISVYHSKDIFTCEICYKKFKSKKYLSNHKRTHKKNKIHDCNFCNQKFFLKTNLERHKRNKHLNAFNNLNNKQVNVEYYKCQFCSKAVKLKSSLMKHLKKCHGNENFDPKAIVKDVAVVDVKNDKNKNDAKEIMIDLNPEINIIKENRNQENGFNDELILDTNLNVNNQEVCLSMPELNEVDQNITLGDNAFILENGTIVEPLDQGNFVVYILGQ
nr:zinc finger protein 271-like isoform X1 [Onthophagus taurus]